MTPPPQRERFSYTRYQLELLNTIYMEVRYPNSMQKQLIAKRVGITRDQVKVCYHNIKIAYFIDNIMVFRKFISSFPIFIPYYNKRFKS